ncbi:lasso peptide biosynthesis PqqD family chaperone [Paenibacillus sp. sgz500958]|uniref:lasso peptide biosynthesis PqqD family chaperone n=1 Tax=Paenibacillus sp. sgz500958 TaxID=3242475 RepID=UPI0036D2B0D8
MTKNSVIFPNTVLAQCEGNVVSDMDGEKVMFSLQQGKYYNLGQVGGDIWTLLNTPKSLQDLIASLQQQYDIEPEACEQDVVPFLQHLLHAGLIRIEVAP